jgi:hypothetical protein
MLKAVTYTSKNMKSQTKYHQTYEALEIFKRVQLGKKTLSFAASVQYNCQEFALNFINYIEFPHEREKKKIYIYIYIMARLPTIN